MPDPSYMSIRYETLQQSHDDLTTAYQAVQNTVSTLETDLAASLQHWSGAARDAYGPIKAQWDNAVNDMAAVLQKAYMHLGKAFEMYQDVERQNVSIWNP